MLPAHRHWATRHDALIQAYIMVQKRVKLCARRMATCNYHDHAQPCQTQKHNTLTFIQNFPTHTCDIKKSAFSKHLLP